MARLKIMSMRENLVLVAASLSILLGLAGCGNSGILVDKRNADSNLRQPLPGLSFKPVADQLDATQLPDYSKLSALSGHQFEIIGIFPIFNSSTSSYDRVVSADKGGEVLVWDLNFLKAYRLINVADPTNAICIGRGGVIAASDRAVGYYSVSHPGELAVVKELKSRITSLALQPGQPAVVMGGADGRIYRWRFKSDPSSESSSKQARGFERYIGPSSVVSSVKYHPEGRVFFVGDWHGRLYAWLGYEADPFEGAYDENLFGKRFFSDSSVNKRGNSYLEKPIVEVVTSVDGQLLLVTTENGGLELWQVRGFRRVAKVDAHAGLIYGVAISPDGQQAVTTGRDGHTKVWYLTE